MRTSGLFVAIILAMQFPATAENKKPDCGEPPYGLEALLCAVDQMENEEQEQDKRLKAFLEGLGNSPEDRQRRSEMLAPLFAGMVACREHSDDVERLACFDDVASKLKNLQ